MAQEFNSDELSGSESNSLEKEKNKKQKKNNAKNKGKIIINISDCQYPVVSRVAKGFGWKLQSSSQATDWDVCWTDNAVQPEILSRMEPHQKINHFPGMFNLARKNLMGRYLMKMRKKFPEDYTFFPLTWMLPVQYHQLKSYFQSKPKGKARTFIVKPEALSQGKGIFLTRKLQQIDQNAHCVVQRYLHRPYLIQSLKFDLRVYVLVASVDPLRLFIYHQGLTRFATQKYQPPTKDNMEDVCMHLTNYAINKDNPKFVFNNSSQDMSKGHKRSLTWLLQYIQKNDPRGANLKQKIQDMIVKTMISGLPAITNTYRSCQPQNYASNMCFELLGFDVMLTDKCEPVLLEINHTPSFTTDTPLDNLIKTNYIRDSLTIMNISFKNKEAILKERKEACQQRVITGKKMKLTNEEKQIEKKKAHEEREKYEMKNLGGFKKIYPLDNAQRMAKYQQFLTYSTQTYLISTGTKKTASVSRRTDKIQTAFGTCFTKKVNNTAKPTVNFKNRAVDADSLRNTNIIQRKYETKKIICDSLLEKEGNKLTFSQNLISPLSMRVSEKQQIKNQNSFEEFTHESNQHCPKQMHNSGYQGNSLKRFFDQDNFESIPIIYKSMKQAKSEPSHRGYSFKKSLPNEKQAFDIIAQKQQLQSHCLEISNDKTIECSETAKDQQPKYHCQFTYEYSKINSGGREKNLAQKNVNNVEIFFDFDKSSSSFAIKRNQKQMLSACNPNTVYKNEQCRLGIFGINQITADDRSKYKTPIHPKSVSNIQNLDAKKSRLMSNREKIPILLNTLLIGSSDNNPAVSAHNLRKILTKQSK